MFLHLSAILFTGGGGSALVHAGIYPLNWADTSRANTPPGQTPLGGRCSGQYAS